MAVTKEEIAARAASVAFGKPLVMNVLRAIIIETIVDAALGAGWKWCSGDYNGWDFEHTDRTRLEVKQSAALQSWPTTKESAAIFDIAPRAGYWVDGIRWVKETARHAHIYVFARHPVTDIARADHRDPSHGISMSSLVQAPLVHAFTQISANDSTGFYHPNVVSQM